MNRIMHELYTFEDKTSDEVLLINGFQHINQLIPYINNLQQENQSLKEENKKLKQWDCNKDSRNSRQRVANAKLIKENQSLKDRIEKVNDIRKVLNNEILDMLPFDIAEQVQDLFDEILKRDK